MPNVYIVTRSVHDFSDAKRFGDLKIISEGSISRYQTSQLMRVIEPIIDKSSPDDFIMMTGLTIAVSLLCTSFALKHGRLNLLIYRPHKKLYIERSIIFGESR